jgi:uncharacterized protein (TIGR02145 family)
VELKKVIMPLMLKSSRLCRLLVLIITFLDFSSINIQAQSYPDKTGIKYSTLNEIDSVLVKIGSEKFYIDLSYKQLRKDSISADSLKIRKSYLRKKGNELSNREYDLFTNKINLDKDYSIDYLDKSIALQKAYYDSILHIGIFDSVASNELLLNSNGLIAARVRENIGYLEFYKLRKDIGCFDSLLSSIDTVLNVCYTNNLSKISDLKNFSLCSDSIITLYKCRIYNTKSLLSEMIKIISFIYPKLDSNECERIRPQFSTIKEYKENLELYLEFYSRTVFAKYPIANESDEILRDKTVSEISLSLQKNSLINATIRNAEKQISKYSTCKGISCDLDSIINYVKIGGQIWMVNDLDVDRFRNGDIIPQAKSNLEWENARKHKKPAWCYYNNDSLNGEKCGKLYNWYAINDTRGLSPYGWHVTTCKDWDIAMEYLGGEKTAAWKMLSIEWNYLELGFKVSNESGLSLQPGGIRFADGEFSRRGGTNWWLENYCDNASKKLQSIMFYFVEEVTDFTAHINKVSSEENAGNYVRCVKD